MRESEQFGSGVWGVHTLVRGRADLPMLVSRIGIASLHCSMNDHHQTLPARNASRSSRPTLSVGALGGISLLRVLAIACSGGWGETAGLAGYPARTGISELQRAAPITRYDVRRQQRQAERPPIVKACGLALRGGAFVTGTIARLPSRQVAVCSRLGLWQFNLPPPAMGV